MNDICRSMLVLGGARSGKSRYAQGLAETCGRPPVLIATAEAGDAEMAERIARHQHDRSDAWHVVEEPLDLPTALMTAADVENIVVVDCITLWLANLLHHGRAAEVAVDELVQAVATLRGPVIFVSNEVGAGIVPDNALARTFRDAQGRANQLLARACDHVVLITAGLPLLLKHAPLPDVRF